MGLSSVGNIIMNLILIPLLGLYGAGLSTAFSYILYLGLSWFISWKYLPWKFPIKTLFNTVVASTLMSILLIILKLFVRSSILNLLLLSIIGFMVYIIIIYLINEIKEEMAFIKNRYSVGLWF